MSKGKNENCQKIVKMQYFSFEVTNVPIQIIKPDAKCYASNNRNYCVAFNGR